ncbi:MAG: DUF1761 domain-containing protein [Saprospiraceae bacterium]|nr:DUF1761 domain-containing protein [Saprospiraceae bacterium]
MQFNFVFIFVAALIPLLVGGLWYHPKVFGTAWAKAAGVTDEQLKSANMLLIFGLTYVLGIFAALALSGMVIHQAHIYSVLMNEPGLNEAGSELNTYVTDFMAKYGDRFRTFKHGAFHGVLAGIMFALPILGINALFDRKGFKYIAINTGFWIVSLALMGGVLCAYL